MSRIGNKIIAIPDGVEISIQGGEIGVKGKKGAMKQKIIPGIEITQDGKELKLVRPEGSSRQLRAAHGLMRSLIANMIKGVSDGFEKKLKIVGVGYRAEVKGKGIKFALGYSHPIEFPLPEGIQANYDKNGNVVSLNGCDKRLLGEVAAKIRKIRPPEPYKGKGVMYTDEVIRRKSGKSAGK